MSDKLIKSAYEMLNGLTPMKGDCGRLCQSACCTSEGSMLLFPYEYEILQSCRYDFKKSQLDSFGQVWSMTCSGSCDRELRPLACRIFPMAPKIISGELFARLDARGRSVCLLCHKSIMSLDKEFTSAVKRVLIMLSEDDKILRYLSALSEQIDKYTHIL